MTVASLFQILVTFPFLSGAAAAAPLQTDPSDLIYDETVVATFEFDMLATDWNKIVNDPLGAGDTYQRANMTWRSGMTTETVSGVGLKASGESSRLAGYPKPTVTISFNEFEFSTAPERKWRAVKKIRLDSNSRDDPTTFMRERLAHWVYRGMGVPAPRACHARVYVNGDFKGVYVTTEMVRADFAEYRWGEDYGNLYRVEYDPTDAYAWRGSNPASYVPLPFKPETNEVGGDYRDVVELCDIFNGVALTERRSRLERAIHFDGFLSYLGVTAAIVNEDSILRANPQEHFWYHRLGTNRMEIIPWDADSSFILSLSPQTSVWYGFEGNAALRWINDDAVSANLYRAKLRQTLDGPLSQILTRHDTIYNQITPHVEAHLGKLIIDWSTSTWRPMTNQEFHDGVAALRNWISQRLTYLRSTASQIGTAPANLAGFVSANVPAQMVAGRAYPVSVEWRNLGSAPWTEATTYRLTSRGPRDNMTWGLNRVTLAPGESIPTYGTKTFTFTVTAPSMPATYTFQWSVVHDASATYFDEVSPAFSVTVGEGAVLREVYRDISGTAVSNLTSHSSYPARPDAMEERIEFEAPAASGDTYGSRMRGIVTAPAAGNYTFWIAADETAELWLSMDENPANRVLIASVPASTAPREWTRFSQQRSAPIALQAGQRCYIEALHKEGLGTDHLAAGWTVPGQTGVAVIPGRQLSLPGSFAPPMVTIAVTDGNASEPGTDVGTFTVSRTGSTTAALTVNFSVGGTALNGTDYASLGTFVTIPAGQSTAVLTVTPINNTVQEADETAIVTLSGSASYTLGSPASAMVTIHDDDLPSVMGLRGDYYDTPNFIGARQTRTDSTVDFNWGAGSPSAGIGADTFSVRWTGQVNPAFDESYTFYTFTNDGVRLWIDGELLVDQWSDQAAGAEWSGTIALLAGQKVTIQMDYYDNLGDAAARLLWSSPSTPKAAIPQARLDASPGPPDGRDNDGDGIPNDQDLDDDQDGLPDLQDLDRDGDGAPNVVESASGTDPNDSASFPPVVSGGGGGGGGGGGCGATGMEAALILALLARLRRRKDSET